MGHKIYFDTNKCTGCGSCAITCMDAYNTNPHHAFRKIYEKEYLKDEILHVDFYSINCQHCEEAICMSVCPKQCFHRDKETGIVILDAAACIGCKKCIKQCKFGAIGYNREKKAVKCNGCFERIKDKQVPKCVEDCFVQALSLKEMDKEEHAIYYTQLKEEIHHFMIGKSTRRQCHV